MEFLIFKKFNWTPLHFAVEKKKIDVVRLLLSNDRVNVNCKDFVFESSFLMWHKYGNCMPLHHAVYNQDIPMMKLLLSSPKIDVNCKNGDGMTPLHLACLENKIEIVKILLETKKVDTSIKSAIYFNNFNDGILCFFILIELH